MTTQKYKVLKYEADLLQVHLAFDESGRFLVAQMQNPLPVTAEEFDAWVRNFLPRYEVVSARQAPHTATDDLVNGFVGTERTVEISPPPAPTAPEPTNSAELEAAQEAYIGGIVDKILKDRGLA